MTEKIEIRALNRKMHERIRVSTPTNAHEFRKNEILQQAAARKFLLELLDDINKPAVCIQVTDGHNKKHLVEVYGKFSSCYQCSCLDFIEDESNYCVHIAAIQNVVNNTNTYGKQNKDTMKWVNAYMQGLRNLPWRLDAYKQQLVIYDSNKKREIIRGTKPGNLPAIRSVTVDVYRRLRTLSDNADTLSEDSTPVPVTTMDSREILTLNDIRLYDYQEQIFAKMLGAKRAICSMVMGAGKTLTTIACCGWILKHRNPKAKFLVVCPKSLRLQWQREFDRALGIKAVQVDAKTDLSTVLEENNVLITTYQFLTRHIDRVQKEIKDDFDCIVVDEIQFVRNSDTKTWKAISKLESEYFFGLSGTVIENRLDDLYSIMEIIDVGALGPKWRFDDDFQNLISLSKHKILYKGVKNLDKLHDRLRDYVFSYDQLKLPDISYHFVRTNLTAQERTAHDDLMEEAKRLIAKVMNGYGTQADKMRIQSLLLKARQACNSIELLTKQEQQNPSSKIREFHKLIQRLCVEENEKVVVFSEWTEMLRLCQKDLPVNFVLYTGEQSLKQRDATLKKFQTDPDCKIFFSSDAGGIGLDGLQFASRTVIHVELPWNPARLDQRTGRVYRIPQAREVQVFHLVSDGGIEQQIEGLLQEKREVRQLTLHDLAT